MIVHIILSIIIVQRLVELVIAKRNEQRLREQGAFEVGAAHYPWMVAMHSLFFISLLTETTFLNRPLSPFWLLFASLFVVAQVMRIWCLRSLGKFWNTKIIILPGANVVRRGPYKWMRHPNNMIVSIELLVLPLLFNAYITAIAFTLLNALILSIRTPLEEKALKELTDYRERFSVK